MIESAKIIFKSFRRVLSSLEWGFLNSDKSLPVYTTFSSSGLKVHLGSGPINIQGWINVDARDYEHVHLVSNGFDLHEFADGGIAEIYLCHVLEHFSFKEAEALLKSLKIKLRPGGVIRISVPCFDSLIEVYKMYCSDITKVQFALMGGQDYQYNFHKSVYNLESLTTLLEHCGYTNVLKWETLVDFGVDLGDWSNRTFTTNQEAKYISLNLKAVC
jgi:predicted SAM-dependent methyltransferase